MGRKYVQICWDIHFQILVLKCEFCEFLSGVQTFIVELAKHFSDFNVKTINRLLTIK